MSDEKDEKRETVDIEDLDSGRVTTAVGGRSSRLKEASLMGETFPNFEDIIEQVPNEEIQKEIDRKNDLRILEEAKANSRNIAEMMKKKKEATDVSQDLIK